MSSPNLSNRSISVPIKRYFAVPGVSLLLLLGLLLIVGGTSCGGGKRQREMSRLDSLTRDSAQPSPNPYKMGQGTNMYNRERENLGNLDSLVTPAQPNLTH